MTNATAIVTAFKRPDSLRRCVESLAQHYPTLRVVVVDTGEAATFPMPDNVAYLHRPDLEGNLSAARNAGVQACRAELLWVLEDDFELTDSSALPRLASVLEHDPELGVVGGALIHEGRYLDYAIDIPLRRGKVLFRPSSAPWKATDGGTLYRECEMTFNFFLMRRDVALENKWDEKLPLHEHVDWFLSLKTMANWGVAFCPQALAVHHQDRHTEYGLWRCRAKQYKQVFLDKWGLSDIAPEDVHRSYRDRQANNIVVLGTGRCGSTILVKQLAALGWHVGPADEEYAEHVPIRELNIACREGKPLDLETAERLLYELPQPWVIKDPRFCETLTRWLPALAPYEPLLLWLDREPEAVKQSLLKQHWNPKTGERRLPLIKELYDLWPWGKLHLHYEHLAQAVELFDVERANRPLSELAREGEKFRAKAELEMEWSLQRQMPSNPLDFSVVQVGG